MGSRIRPLPHGETEGCDCAATLIHAGGGDLHAIKETLRHGTIQLASDTYTSLLTEVDREIAEKAAALVPRARRRDDVAVSSSLPETAAGGLAAPVTGLSCSPAARPNGA